VRLLQTHLTSDRPHLIAVNKRFTHRNTLFRRYCAPLETHCTSNPPKPTTLQTDHSSKLTALQVRKAHSPVNSVIDIRLDILMGFIDIFSLILSLLGIYGIVFSLRLLLPRNIVPLVSTSLKEAMATLEDAEATNTPNMRDFRANLAMYAHVYTHQRSPLPPLLTEPSLHNQFLQMRTESHRSPRFFQQLGLLFLCGLTWRLYTLKSRIEAIRRKIEV
jgi:hypothetical protein